MSLRSAVVVPIFEAPPIVDVWRERTCGYKPSNGVQAHVTLVFPFAPAEQLSLELVAGLRELLAEFGAFAVEFRSAHRFPQTLYLEPEPAEPFRRLTDAVGRRFPEWPPYQGEFAAVVPHLTVAEGEDELLDAAEADIAPFLPFRAGVRRALLLEEIEPHGRRWQAREVLPLGEA